MQTVSVLKDVHTHGIACLAFDLDGQVCNFFFFLNTLRNSASVRALVLLERLVAVLIKMIDTRWGSTEHEWRKA